MNRVSTATKTHSRIEVTIACFMSYVGVAAISSMVVRISALWADLEEDPAVAKNLKHGLFVMSISAMFGYVINGVVFTKIDKRIGLTVGQVLMITSSILISLEMKGATWFFSHGLFGFGLSMFEVCVNSFVLDTWQGHRWAASFFQALFYFQGIGSYFALFNLKMIDLDTNSSTAIRHTSMKRMTILLSTCSLPVIALFVQTVLVFAEAKFSRKKPEEHLEACDETQDESGSIAKAKVSGSRSSNVQAEQPGQRPELPKALVSFLLAGPILMFFSASVVAASVYFPIFASKWADGQTLEKAHSYMTLSGQVGKIFAFIGSFDVAPFKLSFFYLVTAAVGLPLLYLFGHNSPNFINSGCILFGFAQGAFANLFIFAMEQEKHLTIAMVGFLLFIKQAGYIIYSSYALALRQNITSHSAASLFSISVTLVLFLAFLKFRGRKMPLFPYLR